MSEKKDGRVNIDVITKSRLDLWVRNFSDGLSALISRIGPADKDKSLHQALADIDTSIQTGFAAVAAEIAKLQTPEPPPAKTKGIIVARFRVPADNPDFTIELTGSGFTDSENNPTGAGDIDFAVESSNPDAVSVSLSDQKLSEDGQSITANVAVHVGAPAADAAAINYKATNRDTGALVASGSDEFIVQAGEASVGAITSSVPLTPES